MGRHANRLNLEFRLGRGSTCVPHFFPNFRSLNAELGFFGSGVATLLLSSRAVKLTLT